MSLSLHVLLSHCLHGSLLRGSSFLWSPPDLSSMSNRHLTECIATEQTGFIDFWNTSSIWRSYDLFDLWTYFRRYSAESTWRSERLPESSWELRSLTLFLLHRCRLFHFIAVNLLRQDSAKELITDVCVQDEELQEIWIGENGWNNQTPSQCIKWVSAVLSLIKVLSIGLHCFQRTSKIRKSRHTLVVTTEALELSDISCFKRKVC